LIIYPPVFPLRVELISAYSRFRQVPFSKCYFVVNVKRLGPRDVFFLLLRTNQNTPRKLHSTLFANGAAMEMVAMFFYIPGGGCACESAIQTNCNPHRDAMTMSAINALNRFPTKRLPGDYLQYLQPPLRSAANP